MSDHRRINPEAAVNRPLFLAGRRVLRLLAAPLARHLLAFRVVGGEKLPAAPRPLILAANHAAFVDSVFFILAVGPRFTICGARPRLYRNVVLRGLMALANILRVDSHHQFLTDCRALLAAGEILLVYPEMGRRPAGLGAFETWAAEVALASGAPLLPCYLYGTTRGHRPPPRLHVGDEIVPAGDAAALTARLRRAIVELSPEDPGGPDPGRRR